MKKIELWQFFTKNDVWLKAHIKEFIKNNMKKNNIVFDPFAWWWDLLNLGISLWFKEYIWFDIDKTLKWEYNNSLENIPRINNSFIITNPPYLTNYSAKRKWIIKNIEKYFNKYDDLYKLALEKIFENNDYWIVIIPETFINSSFPKNRLVSITVLEENPFLDTDTPVCVICFDDKEKDLSQINIYKNEVFLWKLDFFESKRLKPKKNIKISFNDLWWQIALRAVDMTTKDKEISFMRKEDLKYNLSWIKKSSRLITIINIELTKENCIDNIIQEANNFLYNYRKETYDVLFSPFKWNTKEWRRRRRIDYKTARAILEEVILSSNQLKIWII